MSNEETMRVQYEAQGIDVTVDGWQEGSQNVRGFVTVTDKTTRTTFAVKRREPLADALGRTRARMAAGRRRIARDMAKHKSQGILGGAGMTNAVRTKGGGL